MKRALPYQSQRDCVLQPSVARNELPRETPGLTWISRSVITGSEMVLINTPLQRGERRPTETPNRFNGFSHRVEIVKTVFHLTRPTTTPLKRGVNERPVSQAQKPSEISGSGPESRWDSHFNFQIQSRL